MGRLECLVCFDALETSKEVHVSTCGHLLHSECWLQCLSRSAHCPQCRKTTSYSCLIKVFLPLGSGDDINTLQNKIDSLKVELICKAKENEKYQVNLASERLQNLKLQQEIDKYVVTVNGLKEAVNLKKIAEAEDSDLVGKLRSEIETLKKYQDQTEELKKVKKALEKAKKAEQIRNLRSKNETEMFQRYQSIVEGLKKCIPEFKKMKKCEYLVEKLKIFTDDVGASADLKTDIKKDPEKYIDMFQEVKNFWNCTKKREDELNKCPKGFVIHLTGFPPNRKDVLKVHLQNRIEYYEGKVAYITYFPGSREAFVRLEAGKTTAEQVVSKLSGNKLRIKNFIVDAVALQGEEEIKFLKQSLEARDRKTGRFNSDLDFSDENLTKKVGRLEYFMSLIAVF